MRRTRRANEPSPSEASAELSSYEGGDRIRQLPSLSLGLSLREQSHDGLRAGTANQHSGVAVQLGVESFDVVEKAGRQRSREGQVLLHLWKRGHYGGRLAERSASN